MKILIVYYSQSGNTQKIARSIRDGMREAGNDVTLKFIKKVSFDELKDYDMIGFGSPIWYEMPPNVRYFVEDMPRLEGKMSFLFNTHCTLPALYFPLAVPRLIAKGLAVLGWKDWYGDSAIQIFPEPYYTAGHPDEIDLAEAKEFGKEICRHGEKYMAGDLTMALEAPRPCMSQEHANVAIDHLSSRFNIHGRLVRDPEKCLYPKCHLCMDNCTQDFIDLSKNKFGNYGDACDDCHGCTYCEMICPSGAIHPVIPYEEVCPVGVDCGHDLFANTLRAAQKEGKFREVHPLDQVGTKTPFYSVYNTHPRMKPLKFDED